MLVPLRWGRGGGEERKERVKVGREGREMKNKDKRKEGKGKKRREERGKEKEENPENIHQNSGHYRCLTSIPEAMRVSLHSRKRLEVAIVDRGPMAIADHGPMAIADCGPVVIADSRHC